MNYEWMFMTLHRRQQSRPSSWKKCKNAKRLSEEGFQIAVKRGDVKSKGEKERYKHVKAEFQKSKERLKKKKKPSSMINAKK